MSYDGSYTYLNARDDWAKTDEDSPTAINVLANDVGALGIVKVNGKTVAADTAPVVLASGATVDLDGTTLRYDPGSAFQTLNAGQSGWDKFTYTVAGSGRSTDTANVKVTIAGENDDQPDANRLPVAADDKAVLPEGAINPDGSAYSGLLEIDGIEEVNVPTYSTSVEIDVLANDTDPEGAPLKVATIAGTRVDTDPMTTDVPDTVALDDMGMTTVKLNADGSLTYNQVSFYFQLEDGLEFVLDADGEPVLIDTTLTPVEYAEPKLQPAISFTYTAIDDKGAESNAATVTLYDEIPVLAAGQQIPEVGTDFFVEPTFTVESMGDLDSTDLWLA